MIIHCLYDKLVPISELKNAFHGKNRNKHPPDQIERLAKILAYQGVRYPVKISNQSSSITSGHGVIFGPDLNPNRAIHLKKFSSTPTMIKVSPATDNENADIHSATFKVELPQYFMDTFLESGHSVLDPFGGSRWEKFSGKKTVLLGQT